MKHLNIVMAIVRVFALHVRGAAKENAKVVKEVARMVAKQHVVVDVVKVVKGVAMQCAKVIV